MSTYLTPGVYSEEVSFRPQSIEGVDTSTAGFVGMAHRGPVGAPATGGGPRMVTSFSEFERHFGGLEPLQLEGGPPRPAYLAHAARAFFDNGGRRLYVSRVFQPGPGGGDGVARLAVPVEGGATATWRAAWPGRSGNLRLQVAARRSRNVAFETRIGGLKLVQARGAGRGAVVEISSPGGGRPRRGGALDPHRLYGVAVGARGRQTFYGSKGVRFTPPVGSRIRLLTLDVTVAGDAPQAELHRGLGLHPAHPRFIGRVLGATAEPDGARAAGEGAGVEGSLVRLEWDPDTLGTATRRRLAAAVRLALALSAMADARLEGGDDGLMITAAIIRGAAAAEDGSAGATGLAALAGVADVALVAAPDASTLPTAEERSLAAEYLVAHAEAQRYRLALVDPPPGASVSDVVAFRARLDSSYAALYYPWVVVADPLGPPDPLGPLAPPGPLGSLGPRDPPGGASPRELAPSELAARELALPPGGVVAGLIARNDLQEGVHRAPANLELSGVLRLVADVGEQQQDVLNPAGINVLRRFEGRGLRVWGARTLSSDPEWKYVNVRRLFIYLEHSIDRGTRWAVFEPNGEPLWRSIRRTIEDFLLRQWQNGALQGRKPEEAFFVRCDRSTMTQDDIDNGRLVGLIGVAPTRPAEFVIFRIGQWTASRHDPDA